LDPPHSKGRRISGLFGQAPSGGWIALALNPVYPAVGPNVKKRGATVELRQGIGLDMTDQQNRPGSILPPDRSFGNTLRMVNRLIQRDLGARLAPVGISMGQWYALRTLWVCDGLTQTELAQRSGVAGPAMVIAVRSLLAARLVQRKRHASDQRKYVISLTEKGRALERPALLAAIEANNVATANIPAEDVATCMRVLHAAHQNLIANSDAPDMDSKVYESIE
jgi:DNA-binding MarR family transcriptional regulator